MFADFQTVSRTWQWPCDLDLDLWLDTRHTSMSPGVKKFRSNDINQFHSAIFRQRSKMSYTYEYRCHITVATKMLLNTLAFIHLRPRTCPCIQCDFFWSMAENLAMWPEATKESWSQINHRMRGHCLNHCHSFIWQYYHFLVFWSLHIRPGILKISQTKLFGAGDQCEIICRLESRYTFVKCLRGWSCHDV